MFRQFLSPPLILASLFVFFAFVLSCALGSVSIPFPDFCKSLFAWFSQTPNNEENLYWQLLDLRIQRAVLAFFVGASLSFSGVLMQALLRNPLSDPYILGVSGGAAMGALLCISLGGVSVWVDGAAFLGALSISLLLYLLTKSDFAKYARIESHSPLLILTGAIMASGCGAVVTLLLSLSVDRDLKSMVFWMMGDLSSPSSTIKSFSFVLLLIIFAWVYRHANGINMLAMHGHLAITYGVNVATLRKILFVSSTLLTALSVSLAGSIGFVGLIIPHATRFLVGADHRLLMPIATLLGGGFLMLADTLARTIVAPTQLPVGVITAFIGVPLFLFQLFTIRKTMLS